jgi:hypothetical protein
MVAMKKLVTRGLIGLVGMAALPAVVLAAATCNGLIDIDYVNAPAFSNVGDTLRMKVSLGTGSILGGTQLTIDSFQVDLACSDEAPPSLPCTAEGPVIEYEGDATITTTCPVTWTTGHPLGAAPNEVIFTATPPLDIPAAQATPPGFCEVEFDVKVLTQDPDNDGKIEQLVGYSSALCDNGVLDSGGFQTADLLLAPPQASDFQCYELDKPRIPPPLPVSGVSLVDALGGGTETVTEQNRICNPAMVNGMGTSGGAGPEEVLIAYNIQQTPLFTALKNRKITTSFGTLTANIPEVTRLFVPTLKAIAPQHPGTLTTPTLDHYKCYLLRNVRGVSRTSLSIVDEFGARTVQIDGRQERLCLAASKNGEPVPTPGAGLLCFSVTSTLFTAPHLFIDNQFTRDLGITQVRDPDEVCVGATLLP